MRHVTYKSAPQRCSDCHDDVHGGQFPIAQSAADCGRCHNALKWKPSLFDHERESKYSLKGAHAEVPCAQCHNVKKQVAGQAVVFYKPTARECSACHGGQSHQAQSSNAASQAGERGQALSRSR
jgi:hypothetical protein